MDIMRHNIPAENYPKSNRLKSDIQKWLIEKILNFILSKR